MLNQDIRKTALYIFRNTPVPATIVAAVNICILYLLAYVAECIMNGKHVPIMLLLAVVIIVWDILADYFALRSWLLGKCRFEYMSEPFKNIPLRKKLAHLSIAKAVIYFLLAIPVIIMIAILVFGLLATIADAGFDFNKFFIFVAVYAIIASIVMTVLTFAVYIFASGAQYTVAGMLKRGFIYFARNWVGWIWFNLTLNFVPYLIGAVLKLLFNSNPAIMILYLPVMGYMMIAKAGYVYENILRKEFAEEVAYSYAADSIA